MATPRKTTLAADFSKALSSKASTILQERTDRAAREREALRQRELAERVRRQQDIANAVFREDVENNLFPAIQKKIAELFKNDEFGLKAEIKQTRQNGVTSLHFTKKDKYGQLEYAGEACAYEGNIRFVSAGKDSSEAHRGRWRQLGVAPFNELVAGLVTMYADDRKLKTLKAPVAAAKASRKSR